MKHLLRFVLFCIEAIECFFQVCKKFNDVGKKLLTRGFIQVERRHQTIYKRVKAMLPRRESERKIHPLARYSDVLSALETRISMLNMTFMKYIDNNLCCFIPGKVLDEIQRLLTLVHNSNNPLPRSHELLQEMRDISSMAMEHFEEHILPRLRSELESSTVCAYTASQKTSKVFLVQKSSVTDDIRKIKKQSKTNKQQMTAVSQQMFKVLKKMRHQNMRFKLQATKMRDQERKIHDQSLKIQELESFLADLKKHVEERDQKFSDLNEECNRTREDLSSKTSSKSATVVKSSSSPPKFYKTNIRPRMAQILPVYGTLHFELERKRKSNMMVEIPSKLSRETQEQINNKINENITSNISKNISGKFDEKADKEKSDFSSFISSSLESILKAPISGIRARKRKMSEEIDLK